MLLQAEQNAPNEFQNSNYRVAEGTGNLSTVQLWDRYSDEYTCTNTCTIGQGRVGVGRMRSAGVNRGGDSPSTKK